MEKSHVLTTVYDAGPDNGMYLIFGQLHGRHSVVIIDHDDYPWISAHQVWHGYRYPVIHLDAAESPTGRRTRQNLSRTIAQWHGINLDGLVVDHINDNPDDNRKCNLQLLTPAANVAKAKLVNGGPLAYISSTCNGYPGYRVRYIDTTTHREVMYARPRELADAITERDRMIEEIIIPEIKGIPLNDRIAGIR